MNATVTVVRSQLKDFVELTKPRITLLVLVTAFTGMWLAHGGMPPAALSLFTLLGTGLAAASSGVLNNYVDRQVDKCMQRTQDRALPTGRVLPHQALGWGLFLGLVSFALLYATVNPLTAWLAVGTIAFYVLVYTGWLKRRSPLCTSIGGIAGALPPVIGWAAVTGSVGWPAWVLFGVMFLWQPPHFWALALTRTDEYRRAKLPVLPVVRGERTTKRQMLLYTVALLPATAAMYGLNLVGPLFLAVGTVLGVLYLVTTINFARKPVTPESARQLFGFSILYLFLLFVMMFVDCRCGGAGAALVAFAPLLAVSGKCQTLTLGN